VKLKPFIVDAPPLHGCANAGSVTTGVAVVNLPLEEIVSGFQDVVNGRGGEARCGFHEKSLIKVSVMGEIVLVSLPGVAGLSPLYKR
jgi:hypothetical protein